MRYKTAFLASSLSVLSAVLLPAGVAVAALDEFEPYAFVGALHDTNIFRTADNEDDDTVGHFGAGVDADLKLSRQHLLLDAELDRAEYDSFDELSHTRILGKGTWQWQVGNLWSGNLGYGYKDELSSFDELNTRKKDMRTTHYGFFEAGYQVHPDVELRGGLDLSDVSYEERDRLDRDTSSGMLEVLYRNTRNTRVGIRTRFTEYDIKNEPIVAGNRLDNDYDETEVSLLLFWEGTGKSHLEARLGYTDLSYNELDDRDYKGSTGRLTHIWFVTGKTRINTSIWRETDSRYDEISTYVLTKGISVSPIWSATPKIRVNAAISFENSDYKGENDIRAALGGDRRDDDLWRVRLGADYEATRNLDLSLWVSRADRDSSTDVNDYDYDQINGRATLHF